MEGEGGVKREGESKRKHTGFRKSLEDSQYCIRDMDGMKAEEEGEDRMV